MKVVTARQMQELDRKTINDIGIPGIVLMENAGRGTWEQIKLYFPDVHKTRIAVLCGRGNNGGDGFVIARCFYNAGCDVKAFLLSTVDRVGGDARINLDAFQQMGGSVEEIKDEAQWKLAGSCLKHAGLVVDALLGTGLPSVVKGLYKCVIEDINALSRVPVVSVDIPSGLEATSGKVLGTAVKARLTCTYGLPKRGLFLFPGVACAGAVEVIDIGIPEQLIEKQGLKESLLEESSFAGSIAQRRPESHKGTFGHAFILAGSPGKTGAAAMAAQAAMRTGAGLVTLGVPQSLNAVLENKVTEVMTEPLPDSGEGFLGKDSWPRIRELLFGMAVVAIGPGLSERDETCGLVYRVLESAEVPLIVDADGLNAVAKNPDILRKAKAPVVLTPHPGEMARLMATTTKKIQADRIDHAREFSGRYGVIVVLKGARTIIAEPGGRIYINPTGNPGMASGGMGDVLTGIIAGLAAQGLSLDVASQLAVFVHGLIGDEIAYERGEIGIMATDLIERIPGALKSFIER
jgi:NAD(P)H-hydrate epimerase